VTGHHRVIRTGTSVAPGAGTNGAATDRAPTGRPREEAWVSTSDPHAPTGPVEHLRGSHLGVLGVSTAAHFPFCFFNLLSPLLDMFYGFLGWKVPQTSPEELAHGPPLATTAAI
jgi:hypothetical protein